MEWVFARNLPCIRRKSPGEVSVGVRALNSYEQTTNSGISRKAGPLFYANNEPKSALARDPGDCRDNKGKLAKRVFTC